MLTCASFHFSTIEEYYTGGLFLGPFNGISDGSGALIGLFVLMGLIGNDFWITNVFGSVKYLDVAVLGVCMGQIAIILMCFRNIFIHQKKELKPDDITGEPLVVKYLFF